MELRTYINSLDIGTLKLTREYSNYQCLILADDLIGKAYKIDTCAIIQ